MMAQNISVTLSGITSAQLAAIENLLSEEANPPKKTKKAQPEPTVSEDEDEDFGKKAMTEEDLDEDESDDEDEEEEEDDEPSVSFSDVRAALNKYGEKHPDQARAILSGFNIKNTKELAAKQNEKYWEPVYRKVMAKIKATKKSKK